MSHTIEENIGSTYFNFQEVTSTNDVARSFYEGGIAKHGSVIVAAYQSKGRGQQESAWESAMGENLLVTIILEPKTLPLDRQVFLNMAIALGVRNAIAAVIQKQVSIKWPNDIYIENRKVAGILIENTVQQHGLKVCYAGIGININQVDFVNTNATSIKLETGDLLPLAEFLPILTQALNQTYIRLIDAQYEDLAAEYHKYLFLINEQVVLSHNGSLIDAIVKGVDNNGRLITLVEGKEHYFHNKEVKWII